MKGFIYRYAERKKLKTVSSKRGRVKEKARVWGLVDL